MAGEISGASLAARIWAMGKRNKANERARKAGESFGMAGLGFGEWEEEQRKLTMKTPCRQWVYRGGPDNRREEVQAGLKEMKGRHKIMIL